MVKNAVVVGMVVLLAVGSVWASDTALVSAKGRAAAARPARDMLLRRLPAKSLFCVRVKNLDGSLTAANEFLQDLAPKSFDAKAMALSQLGKLLGDERLRGVNKKGNFAIFGVNVPGESAGRGPMGNLFIGALLPVRDYDKFISRNPNWGEPDDEGISTITVDGRSQALATKFRRSALICPVTARDKLSRVRKLLGAKKQGLANALEAGEIELAATSPVWLYLNVQQGSKLIRPMVFAKIEQMKAQLEKVKESGQGMIGDPAGILDLYTGIFGMLIDGTDHITVGLSLTSDVGSVTVGIKPVQGTEMATIMGGAVGGDFNNLLGYLEDGAMMNLGCKVDRKSLKASYMKLFELMGEMTTDGISEADLNEWKKLTSKFVNALGDSLAISFGLSDQGQGLSTFSIKYVLEVRNEKALKKAIEKELRLIQEGALTKLYKGLGMEIDVKVERDTSTYKGVEIDAAKAAFNMGDEDSLQGQMLNKMWGDGLDYRWAFVDDYCVYSIGGDADKTIRELIDQVKAGGPGQIGSEMKAAMDAVSNSEQADVVGTFNYVRMLNMVSSFIVLPGGASFPEIEAPSQGNIAFAGRTLDGGMTFVEVVLPKQHLLEVKSAFETLGPQIEKQEKRQRDQRRRQSKD